jgi:hypothetical protein
MAGEWKTNGYYTARYSKALQRFIAGKMEADGPMGWEPYELVFEITEETYEHFNDPDFDPQAHLGRYLYCTKPSYNNSAESQAYYAQVEAYRTMMKGIKHE